MAPCCCCGSRSWWWCRPAPMPRRCWALEVVLGQPLAALGGDVASPHRAAAGPAARHHPGRHALHRGHRARAFDALLHRPAGGGLILELERPGAAPDLSRRVERALQAILSTYSPRMLCEETARIFRDITGYDRVMVYRFDDDGHGEVVAEQRRDDLEPYLGNRYPASDIPQIARRLYVRNRVRVLVDIGYTPVPLEPRLSPITGSDLDMSLCFAAQHLADACAVPEEHGRRRDAGRLADGRRPALGPGLLPPLCAEDRPLPDPRRLRVAGRGDRHPHRRAGKLRPGPGRARRPPAGAADDRGDRPRGRLARRAVRPAADPAAAAERQWRRAAVRGPGAQRRRGAGHRRAARPRRLAGHPAARPGGLRTIARTALGDRGAALRRPDPRRRRPAGHPGFRRAGRMAGLVPAGAGADGDLGRRPLQAGDRRQRPDPALAPPVLRQVAPGGGRHGRALDADRPRHRPADRRHRHRRGAAIPRRADADRARPAGAGAPPGRRRRPARGGRRCRGQGAAGQCRLRPAAAGQPGGARRNAWPTCCRISSTAPMWRCGCATCCRTAAAGAAR